MTSDSASRVTRSRRDLRVALALFLGALAVVGAIRAQEAPKTEGAAPPVAAPAETSAAPAPAAPETVSPATAPAAAPAPPDRKTGPSPGRFEPSEKVRADFDVSFPVDI